MAAVPQPPFSPAVTPLSGLMIWFLPCFQNSG